MDSSVWDRIEEHHWQEWEALFRDHAIVIDRQKGSAHPRYTDMVYPFDYGYLAGTIGLDGDEIDCFVGESDSGLIGVMETCDPVKGDREIKLLWNLTKAEARVAERFLNRGSMTAELILREPI